MDAETITTAIEIAIPPLYDEWAAISAALDEGHPYRWPTEQTAKSACAAISTPRPITSDLDRPRQQESSYG